MHKLSASVDADLLAAAEHAVEAGQSENISVWINSAMRRQLEHERRAIVFDALPKFYERHHGEISAPEILDRGPLAVAVDGELITV